MRNRKNCFPRLLKSAKTAFEKFSPTGMSFALSDDMNCGVYKQRNPRNTPLYRIVEDHFDEFLINCEYRYEHHIARAPLSNEKIKYDPQKEIVLYKSKI